MYLQGWGSSACSTPGCLQGPKGVAPTSSLEFSSGQTELSDTRTVCTAQLEAMASIEWDGGSEVKTQISTQLEAG